MSAIRCVIREVAAGDFQYVPVAEVPALVPGEIVYTGLFHCQRERLGPHGSHERTICLPRGTLSQARVPAPTDCVVREVAYRDFQYVPVNEVPAVVPGERLLVGSFRSLREKHGPSGSHERTICLPNGRVEEFVAA